jgi:two-component system cell cycle response regulator DivK
MESDFRNIPIILFSANNDVEKIAREVKADGFLKKPFDINKMTAVIEEHLSSEGR